MGASVGDLQTLPEVKEKGEAGDMGGSRLSLVSAAASVVDAVDSQTLPGAAGDRLTLRSCDRNSWFPKIVFPVPQPEQFPSTGCSAS